MAGAYLQDLRDRGLDAVEQEGMSRLAAARRFGVSEAAAVKWLQRYEHTGHRQPVGTGGHRRPRFKPHPRLPSRPRSRTSQTSRWAALGRRLLAERGVKADTLMLSRFYRREGITLKKRCWSRRAGRPDASRRSAQWRKTRPHRSRAARLHRRDLDETNMTRSRLGATRQTARRQDPARPLEDHHLPGRAAS